MLKKFTSQSKDKNNIQFKKQNSKVTKKRVMSIPPPIMESEHEDDISDNEVQDGGWSSTSPETECSEKIVVIAEIHPEKKLSSNKVTEQQKIKEGPKTTKSKVFFDSKNNVIRQSRQSKNTFKVEEQIRRSPFKKCLFDCVPVKTILSSDYEYYWHPISLSNQPVRTPPSPAPTGPNDIFDRKKIYIVGEDSPNNWHVPISKEYIDSLKDIVNEGDSRKKGENDDTPTSTEFLESTPDNDSISKEYDDFSGDIVNAVKILKKEENDDDVRIEEFLDSSPDKEKISKEYNDSLQNEEKKVEKQKKDTKGRKMNEGVNTDRKLILEFCRLLEKAKQLFNGLRELPQYGHKQWHAHFGRTFDIYTKLWKYQQIHRAVLDTKYGLKRWQIGEIASKIGQLYYHFYLRTSECAYLNEAFAFYSAIRGRSYYTKASKADRCELMIKKLRYYARFIVVCLLLKKIKLVRELIKELEWQIAEYGNTYDPDDQVEWTMVVDEVKAFIQAEQVVTVLHPDNYPVILSHRLTPDTVPPIERTHQMVYQVQEAIIVGNMNCQPKFSELAIDMYRIIQTLERDPLENAQLVYQESPRQRFANTPNAPSTKEYLEEASRRESTNPHKVLLYKPAANQALVYTGSGVLDLLPNGALLLYISGDGYIPPTPRSSEPGYELGGVLTTGKPENREGRDQKSHSKYKEIQCLYPGDLYQFSRSPMFLIVESDNSFAFANMPKIFGYPHITLMSPIELPVPYEDHKDQGSLFTLFLHAPLLAFCYICEIRSITLPQWDRGQSLVENFLNDAVNILLRSRPDPNYIAFIGCDFLRLFILRFIFCETTLRLHRAFRTRNTLPKCCPPLPDELTDHPALIASLAAVASHFQVRHQFEDIGIAGPAPKD